MIAIYTTVLLGLFGNLGSHRSPHDITGWTQLGKTLPAQISQAEPIGAKPRSDLLHIAVSLPYRDPVGMQQFVDSVSDPKSPDYRHFVTPEEVGRRFGLPSSAVQKVVDYLRSVGMQVRLQGKNHLSVLADATVAQVQKAFLTPISLFKVAPSGPMDSGIRFSATSPPSIPSEIAPYVLDVSGLENFTRPRSLGISPAQAKVLYSVAPIFNGGSQGQGRTVAISSFDGFRLANEIAQCETFGLPVPVDGAGTNVSVRSISGGTGQSNYQMSEGDLDIDLAISMAPLCNLIIYDNSEPSGSYDYVGLLTTEADDNSADIVTESYIWVWDSLTQLSAHNLHLSMSAQGITYMAASGDHGTNYFYNPLNEYAAYPMMDPEVLTVGGTTATIDSAGNRISEIGWNGQGDSGGGGWAPTSDPFNVRPGYQLTPLFLAGPGVPSKATSPYRLIPDVALNSDLNTGFLICFNGNVGPAKNRGVS